MFQLGMRLQSYAGYEAKQNILQTNLDRGHKLRTGPEESLERRRLGPTVTEIPGKLYWPWSMAVGERRMDGDGCREMPRDARLDWWVPASGSSSFIGREL